MATARYSESEKHAGMRRRALSCCPLLTFALYCSAASVAAVDPGADALSSDQVEEFLRHGEVVSSRSVNIGITGTQRVTLCDSRVTHEAHVQTVDERKAIHQTARGTELQFRDAYHFNVAAYRLDRMLGLNMTPPAVFRRYKGKDAAFTWWLDDATMEGDRIKKKLHPPDSDSFNKQMFVVRVFDQLVFNTDRNLQNLVITPDWNLWMIDHTRAFRLRTELASPKNLVKCDRKLLENLRRLNEATLKEQLGDSLRREEIRALLKRRDKIVALFDDKIRRQGEAAVLYDLEPRQPVWKVEKRLQQVGQ